MAANETQNPLRALIVDPRDNVANLIGPGRKGERVSCQVEGLAEAGERLYHEVLDLCDGKMSKGEALREWNPFAINRCGPSV